MPCSNPVRKKKRLGATLSPNSVFRIKKPLGKFYRPRNHETPFFKIVRKTPGMILKITGTGTSILPLLSIKGKNDTLYKGDSLPSFLYAQDTILNEFYIRYLSDGKTLYQNSMASGTKWNCPTDGDYYMKFWVDTKAAVNTSEWEYSTYLQQVSLPVISKDEVRNSAQVGIFWCTSR